MRVLKNLTYILQVLLITACGGGGGGTDGGTDTSSSATGSSTSTSAGFVLSKTSVMLTERGVVETFTVKLNSRPTDVVSIDFISNDTSEVDIGSDQDTDSGTDYYGYRVSLDFTPDNWSTPQTIKVQAVSDFSIDGNQTTTIVGQWIWTNDYDYLLASQPVVAATVVDTDVANLTTTTSSLITNEGNTNAYEFGIVISVEPTAPVDIPVTITDASEGSLDSASSITTGTITIDPFYWSSAKTVTFYAVDDALGDGDKNYTITFGPSVSADSNCNGLTLNPITVTNVDNESASFTVSKSSIQTYEWGSPVSFTVTLNEAPETDVIIPVVSADTSEGLVSSDAAPTPASTVDLTFTPVNWQTPQTVAVNPVDDALQDGDIGYNVTIGAPTGAPAFAALSAKTVSVINVDDDVAAVKIQGADLQTTETGNTDTFIVSLSKQPVDTVIVNITSGDITEGLVKGGNSPTVAQQSISLTFTTTDWQTERTITVVGQDDLDVDGAQNYTANITIDTVLTLDAEYDVLSAQTVSITNTDNDVASFSLKGYPVFTEGGPNGLVTVSLSSKPVADVRIPVTVSHPTQFSVSNNGVEFAGYLELVFTPTNWQTPQDVIFMAIDDHIIESSSVDDWVSYGAVISADPAYSGLAQKTQPVSLFDNDSAGLIVNPTSTITVSEDGTSATIGISLTAQPSSNVQVSVTSSNGAEVLLTGGDSPVTQTGTVTLDFAPSQWQSTQTVTVHGQDDAVLDGPAQVDITLSVLAGLDTNFNYVNDTILTAINNDNESGVTETDVPLTQANLPYTGQVASADVSNYLISSLTPGGNYTISVDNVTDNIAIEVRETTGPKPTLCTSSNLGSEQCSFTAPSNGTIEVLIDGAGTFNGAQYVISLF